MTIERATIRIARQRARKAKTRPASSACWIVGFGRPAMMRAALSSTSGSGQSRDQSRGLMVTKEGPSTRLFLVSIANGRWSASFTARHTATVGAELEQGLVTASRILVKLATAHQALRNIGCLECRALGGRMCCKVARHRDQDVAALIDVAPLAELSHACLQHLVCVKVRVFPEQRVRESRDERLRRVTKRQVARDQTSGRVDLPLAIECAQQSRADFLDRVGKLVQLIAAFAGQPGGWHIEVAGEVDRHRPVKHATGRVDSAILLESTCAGSLQGLVNGVGVGEDVEGGFQSACSFA